MSTNIDVVLIVPRDHELECFLKEWPLKPADHQSSNKYVVQPSTAGYHPNTPLHGLRICIESLENGQGLIDAYIGCCEIIRAHRPSLIILTGTAGVFPGGDITLSDIVWCDAKNCIALETFKADSDGSFRPGYHSVNSIIKNLNVDFAHFREIWKDEILPITSQQATFDLNENATFSSEFRDRVKRLQGIYDSRSGRPEIIRASSVYSTNARISDPALAEQIMGAGGSGSICEMELAGVIRACNEFKTSLASIRVISDVIGTTKRDVDSNLASTIASNACFAFLGIPLIQKAIFELRKQVSPLYPIRGGDKHLTPLLDAISRLPDVSIHEMNAIASTIQSDLNRSRVTIYAVADVLNNLLGSVCCGCGYNVGEFFQPFSDVIYRIAKEMDPQENLDFFLKALEVYGSLGDTAKVSELENRISAIFSANNNMTLNQYRQAIHIAPKDIKIDLIDRGTSILFNHDNIDPCQAAIHLSCMLCQNISSPREKFEKTFDFCERRISQISPSSTRRGDILIGKAIVLRSLNEWLTQENGWKQRAQELISMHPSTAWLTPATRVLYLTLAKALSSLSIEEESRLARGVQQLRSSPIAYTCNLNVLEVIDLALHSDPLSIDLLKLRKIIRPAWSTDFIASSRL